METEPYPASGVFNNIQITFNHFTFGLLAGILAIILLLFFSAMISGSEVAFFSLSPGDIEKMQKKKTKINKLILKLLDIPERLLATILIANNFINVAIVILTAYVSNSLIDFSQAKILGIIFNVVFITFLLLLFGEILPKIYATLLPRKFAAFMAYPLLYLNGLFRPISSLLMYSTSFVNKRVGHRGHNISINDLSHALELTSSGMSEDKNILKRIVKFGNIDVKEIMKSRVDVTVVDNKSSFSQLINIILESGYSRIPVFEDTFDNVRGVLYIKDLLPHLHKNDTFKWQELIRPPYFVPENKKINDLLTEFQTKKIHLALVIDEYGGTSGIVTLEDILEEIVGEITDESDDDEIIYSKQDNNNYIFEGKILLNDFFKITNIKDDVFDEVKGEADTLAGLILELRGEIPEKNSTVSYKNFNFRIESADKRRIKQIKVTINNSENTEE
ncbi:MAG TPA: gliding motility-associated protein GldE [Bacteroidales bacterium]|nr:gliding motility-associated protein GldE [Bacteroidales bacterium]